MPRATTSSSRGFTAELLRDEILAVVTERQLEPGDQLPTEQELGELIGRSRSTIREALKLLEQEGLVHAVQGKGRFLSGHGTLHVERPMTRYESTTEMLQHLGYTVTTVVLSVEETTASVAEQQALGLAPDAAVIRLVRLRCGDDAPMVFSINAVPRELLPGPVAHRDWSSSVSEALEGHGHRVASSLARISASNVPEEDASRYDLARFDPWLLVEETCITASGERALYSNDYHRGSKIAFNVLRRS